MARVVMTLLGLGMFGAGIWLSMRWWLQVLVVLQGVAALGLTVLGLAVLIFGINEIAGALARRAADHPDVSSEGPKAA